MLLKNIINYYKLIILTIINKNNSGLSPSVAAKGVGRYERPPTASYPQGPRISGLSWKEFLAY